MNMMHMQHTLYACGHVIVCGCIISYTAQLAAVQVLVLIENVNNVFLCGPAMASV